MPNIASVLKEEITRLARKEIRVETERLKKVMAQCRSEISALKSRVNSLEKQIANLGRKSRTAQVQEETKEGATRIRFSAKGLAKQRQKVGLSAADFGLLSGVSAQTIYNWEAGKSTPREKQKVAVAALRGIGKRQLLAKLQGLGVIETSQE